MYQWGGVGVEEIENAVITIPSIDLQYFLSYTCPTHLELRHMYIRKALFSINRSTFVLFLFEIDFKGIY